MSTRTLAIVLVAVAAISVAGWISAQTKDAAPENSYRVIAVALEGYKNAGAIAEPEASASAALNRLAAEGFRLEDSFMVGGKGGAPKLIMIAKKPD